MKRLALVALVLAGAVLGSFLLRREPGRAQEREEPTAPPASAAGVLAPLEARAEPALDAPERAPVTVTPDGEASASSAAETDEVLLEPEDSVLYHALVLDALTRRPIAGARAWIGGKGESVRSEASSDAGGRLALALPARTEIGSGRLEAGGYGTLAFVYDAVHETPARADELELLAAAGLEVLVRDEEGRPLAGCEVALTLPGEMVTRGSATLMMNERASWKGLADATGIARFESLPAEEALDWRVGDEDGPARRLGRIALEVGAIRRLDVQLGGRARLAGRVRDENGSPVARLRLCLGTAGGTSSPEISRTKSPVARIGPGARRGGLRAVSDESGRFAFEGLAYDEYSLSLQPGEQRVVLPGEERVLVDRPSVERDLDVVGALFVSGRFTGPPEAIQGFSFVNAKRPDGSGFAYAELDGDAFRIGPLAPGEYLVWASEGTYSTAMVSAVAGASDVELPVLASREFDVRVDAAEGELEITVLDLERLQGLLWSETEASFPVRLPPGRYALQAATTDGRIAYRGDLVVSADEPRGKVVLHAEPGARCTFVHRATSGTRSLRVRSRGEPFPLLGVFGPRTEVELLPGAARTVLLPPGALEVELLEAGRVVVREELVLLAGERRRIELVPR